MEDDQWDDMFLSKETLDWIEVIHAVESITAKSKRN